MSEIANLERVRTAALAHVEKSEKRFKLALFIAGLLELVFLVSFVLVMDRSNKLHVMLFFSTVGIYTLIWMGLIVLGTHINVNTQRILKAIELTRG